MHRSFTSRFLSRHVWTLLAVYFAASLAHFAHNAEFIAFYPNMPVWLTREKVYLAWLAVTSFGIAGLIVLRLGLHAVGTVLIAAYGGLGLDGLAHYTLALCSEHTLVTNLTIWFEAVAGFALALASIAKLFPKLKTLGHPRGEALFVHIRRLMGIEDLEWAPTRLEPRRSTHQRLWIGSQSS